MFETFELPLHALDTFQCGQPLDAHFRRLNVWGNGTCFFHSVATLLVHSNVVENNTILYHLAIPTTKNLQLSSSNSVQVSNCDQTVYLTFSVPLTYDGPKFYRNFEQVGIQLRKYLSYTVTKERYAAFQREAFSSDLKWALAGKAPDWVAVKAQLSNPAEWADIWTVKYAAWALSLNLLFINGTSREEPVFCGVENFRNGPWTLFIFWSGKVHFEPIVQVSEPDESPPTITQRAFLTDHHPFIKCLEQRFQSSEQGGCRMEPNSAH